MTCPRLWQVTALRDGRLVGAEAAAVARHATSCAECARESAELAEMGERLRAAPVVIPDEVAIRRGRQALLERADASVTGRHRPVRLRRAPLLVAACVVLASIAIWLGLPLFAPSVPTVSVNVPVVVDEGELEIVATAGADWSRESLDGEKRVTLRAGEISLRVRRAPGSSRVIVTTPDAEIEDIGTRFSVRVDSGETRAVRVDEGRVVLRRAGEAPVELSAGESWSAPPRAPSQPVKAVRSGAFRTSPPLGEPVVPQTAAPTASGAPSSAPTVDLAARDFSAALALYQAGSFADAADRFAVFVGAHGGDVRVEDALYLRAVAFARAGRSGSARLAARDYLARNPNGFRAPEMRRLAE